MFETDIKKIPDNPCSVSSLVSVSAAIILALPAIFFLEYANTVSAVFKYMEQDAGFFKWRFRQTARIIRFFGIF